MSAGAPTRARALAGSPLLRRALLGALGCQAAHTFLTAQPHPWATWWELTHVGPDGRTNVLPWDASLAEELASLVLHCPGLVLFAALLGALAAASVLAADAAAARWADGRRWRAHAAATVALGAAASALTLWLWIALALAPLW